MEQFLLPNLAKVLHMLKAKQKTTTVSGIAASVATLHLTVHWYKGQEISLKRIILPDFMEGEGRENHLLHDEP